MLAAVLVLSLAQAPVTMAVPSFSFVGVDPALGAAWQDRFVSRLSSPRLRVTSAKDIQQLIGLERQRSLLGCDAATSTSCLAELAGALGVELLLNGSVVKSESGYLATLRVLRTADGQSVAAPTERLRSEDALLDWLDATAKDLERTLTGGGEPSPVARWVPALVGAGLLVGSGVCFGFSADAWNTLTTKRDLDDKVISDTRKQGETLQAVGIGLAAGGGVAVLASVLWVALAPPSVTTRVQPLATVSSQGSYFGISGVFP